ncbi:pyridoxamine 5'-phosphate oxidase family protein [Microlunatus capsulatus]|uniref:General stress protein 26 n=1 Tax=Microlunatus capsulatus TaxID=99117 RepID=A0ABS4Z8V6_9ACTN|nr:pyridoxamine 5'-phosphate oxidase family protein [Microlunatus capsulatus]MBP2417489.1 general stress protein 26 [Microlunatus capsulatus]
MSSEQDSTAAQRAEVAQLVEKSRIALVTTVAESGKLVSRPLAVQHRDFDGELWFFTQDPSHKTEQVARNPQVNVSFSSDDGWVSVSGTASVTQDPARIDEFWNSHAEAWFDGGRQDPAVALLRVEADSAEYWSVSDPKLVTAVKYAKARLTGQQPDLGENHAVEL